MFASNTSQVANDAVFIEDTFACHLYTGNGSTQTITNGIDLSTYGGMVWLKARTSGGSSFTNHAIIDTARGKNANGYYSIYSNLTEAQFSPTGSGDAVATAVSATGFTVGGNANVNYNTQTDVSWTFRKQPKFFDVVTYTGTGVARTIAHSLGSVPACIIVKCTNAAGKNWQVYHTSLGNASYINLNLTSASTSSSTIWNSTTPTSTVFSLGADGLVNDSGDQYVAYLFAHNAGGFGLTGTDNVISCGSFTTNGSGNATVDLGYEPQWVLVKGNGSGYGWSIFDNMRGMPVTGNSMELLASSSSAEGGIGSSYFNPTATGFYMGGFSASQTYIYIAIRRGPMKVPTSGTSVFAPVKDPTNPNIPSSILVDSQWFKSYSYAPGQGWFWHDRLRQGSGRLDSATTDSEASGDLPTYLNFLFEQTGTRNVGSGFGSGYLAYQFRRAPSFFDEVCYTGTGSARTVTHNLGVAPELMIVKVRDSATDWAVYHSGIGATKRLILNLTDTPYTSATAGWNDTAPTASVFTVGTNITVNGNGYLYVAYLFATCAGVSKVFSYTGNGSSQTINCGFTGGARWILIKRTDSTGDWYVWDSARGIVSANDPHLSLNTTAAEVTTNDTIDTDSTGFVVNQVSATNVNVSSATYIGIAIA